MRAGAGADTVLVRFDVEVGMSQDFSDAPLTVDGITVTPTWAWSKQYRAEVADNMRLTGKSHIPPHERAGFYVQWYAEKHGLTMAGARQKIKGCAA